MAFTFYDDIALKDLQKVNQSFLNGYLIYFDIKNSTARKKEHPERWYAQTEAFYHGIRNLGDRLQGLMSRPEFSNIREKEKNVIIKFIGDSGFAFLPVSYASSPHIDEYPTFDLSKEVLKLAGGFRKDSHANEALGAMRLKAVATYLTGLRLVSFRSRPSKGKTKKGASDSESLGMPKVDILGRGIDFSFRLEKFAGDGHFVINKFLANCLKSGAGTDKSNYQYIDIGGEKHYIIECKKRVKGWDKPDGEQFFLLVTEGLDEDNYPNGSAEREDVEAELFTFHLKTGRDKSSVPGKPNFDSLDANLGEEKDG